MWHFELSSSPNNGQRSIGATLRCIAINLPALVEAVLGVVVAVLLFSAVVQDLETLVAVEELILIQDSNLSIKIASIK